MKLLAPKTMLIIDFICAFSGGVFYLALFEFLQTALAIPYWMVVFQLIANFAYGIFGVLILLGWQRRAQLFRLLVAANLAYSVVCLGLAVVLYVTDEPLGTWLVLAEGLLIFLLAKWERKCLQSAA